MLLHVHELGASDGAPLVALHGLTGHGRRFAPLTQLLPSRRVIAPDLRGHGRSAYDPPWTTEQFVADVLETVDALGVPAPFDLAGVSFGGRVAATLVAQAPERVRRLVLLDPALSVAAELAAEHAEDARATATFSSAQEVVDELLDGGTLFSTPRAALEADVAEHYVRRADDGRLEARVCRAMQVTAWSEMARPAPPRVDRPTLVVTGARSWLPVDVERLAPAEHVEVPGGHSVLWEDLRLTADAVRRFLS